MRRLLFTLAFAGLAAFVAAEDKPARVAIAELDDAKDAFAFIHQGEYEGTFTESGNQGKAGVQLVATSEKEFKGKLFKGGLPGAGSDGKAAFEFSGRRDGDTVQVGGPGFTLTGADGALTWRSTDGTTQTGTFKKVTRTSPTIGAKPPEGAVVLFAKAGDEAQWAGGKLKKLSDGEFLDVGCKSKQVFGDFTAHAEFRLPYMPNSSGQGRGNSGFYLQDRYEIQVLDSFGLKGENNECGGVYTLHKPKVNMCLPPLVWQTYDIDFKAAKYDAAGKKTAPARLTLKHNGGVVHDDVELTKSTGGGQGEGPTKGPVQLQNHGDPVVFRNVWVAEK